MEDDDALREVVGECLRAEGYAVDEAGDGLAALAASSHDAPDAVVLDLVMPRLDGWGFLERMRADQRLRAVPVLLTTGVQVDDAAAIGAQAVLHKPFQLEALLASVARLVPVS